MKVEDILKQKQTGRYIRYELQSLCKTSWSEQDINDYWQSLPRSSARQLARIPAKISYFIDRSKIKKAWKTDCEKDDRDNFYFILSTDGTMFEAHY